MKGKLYKLFAYSIAYLTIVSTLYYQMPGVISILYKWARDFSVRGYWAEISTKLQSRLECLDKNIWESDSIYKPQILVRGAINR